jgi:hypothetical protein
MLTIESEEFDRDHVNRFYRTLSMFGMPASWLVSMPGYSVDVYRVLRAWDHEIGLLFQTDDSPLGNEERLKIQFTSLARLAAQTNLSAIRSQDGKWRGWTHFYDLCEQAGARISLSKGGRQPGTSGFLFGTCHPFVPPRLDGSNHLVTEIPYSVFMPGVVTPDPVAEKILYQTSASNGCYQIVCRSNGIESPAFSNSLRRILSLCKQQRMEFVTPELVHRFERARRHMRIIQKSIDDEGTLQLSSDVEVEGLTVLVNGPVLQPELRGRALSVQTVERYGTKFNVIRLDLEAKTVAELRLTPVVAHQAA